jgi:hypothetical protein
MRSLDTLEKSGEVVYVTLHYITGGGWIQEGSGKKTKKPKLLGTIVGRVFLNFKILFRGNQKKHKIQRSENWEGILGGGGGKEGSGGVWRALQI